MNKIKILFKSFLLSPLVLAALLVSLIACSPSTGAKKINLGRQLGAITLTVGSNNDLNIAPSGNTTTVIRLTPNASGSTVSGMSATQVSDGDLFLVRNEGTAANITFTSADTASIAANRFVTPSNASLILPPHGSLWAEYDATAVSFILGPVNNVGDQVTSGVGHLKASGTAPVLTSCGTSPTISGSDVAGIITTGSGATTCTVTFAATYTTVPSCYFLPIGTATMPVYSVSATAITVATSIASTGYSYACIGR